METGKFDEVICGDKVNQDYGKISAGWHCREVRRSDMLFYAVDAMSCVPANHRIKMKFMHWR